MIDVALSIVKSELERYIKSLGGGEDLNREKEVVLGNIALLESNDAEAIKNKIVMTLVNVEEESALKNTKGMQRVNGEIRIENPPMYLNLYLLFTTNLPPDKYEDAILRLSNIIEFFQGRNMFTIQNSPESVNGLNTKDPEIVELKLILNMYTMTFEQINHLWGSLGGKQIPFVMYKVRLVKIRSGKVHKERKVIEGTRTATEAI